MGAQNYKKFYPKAYDFFVKFKKCEKKYLKIRELFCYGFFLYKEMMLTDRATITS